MANVCVYKGHTLLHILEKKYTRAKATYFEISENQGHMKILHSSRCKNSLHTNVAIYSFKSLLMKLLILGSVYIRRMSQASWVHLCG